MPDPGLTSASYPKLTKNGTSDGTVTGTNVAPNDPVHIENKNGKKTWDGVVTTETRIAGTWNAPVTNTKWNSDEPGPDVPETVTVTVTNSSGGSKVDTTSDIP